MCERLLSIGLKDHTQKGYCVTRLSLLSMGGIGKSLSVWVKLSRAKRPHAKDILYDAFSLAAYGRGWGGGR